MKQLDYIVWRLVDSDLNLWLPTDCETFEQAAAAWLDVVQDGSSARITERVPVALHDARQAPPTLPHRSRGINRSPRNNSRADQIKKALKAAPDGLSRSQLAAATHILKTDVGSTLAGLMKRGSIRTEQRTPTTELGSPGVGRETVTIYFWQD